MQQQDIARLQADIPQLRGPDFEVGAAGDDNLVPARGIHADKGAGRRPVRVIHGGDIDPAVFEAGERRLAEAVAADGTDHAHPGAGPRRRQGLIGALAPWHHRIARAGHGLARRRQLFNRTDEVGVERAEDAVLCGESC